MVDPTAPQTTPVFGVPTSTPVSASPTATPVKKHSGFDNVLGFLGDFLLSRLRMGTPYRDARKNEKLNSALALDKQNPGDFSNLSAVDFGVAQKARNEYTDNQRLQASQADTAENRAARLALQQSAEDERTRLSVKSTLNTVYREKDPDKRAALYDKLLPNVMSGAARRNPNLDWGSEIPQTFDPDIVGAYIGGAATVSSQNQQQSTQDRMQQQSEQFGVTTDLKKKAQAETVRHHKAGEAISQQKANRPSAPRTGRRPTEGDVVQAILDRGGRMSPGERARVHKYTNGTRGAGKQPTFSGW